MKQEEWLEQLTKLFQDEIDLYSNVLELETQKSAAVVQADGKSLEVITKRTYELLVMAAEIERVRMKSIEEVYRSKNFALPETGAPTLSDFLNRLDRDSNFKLKEYGSSLKSVLHRLKEKIKSNEKLILTRQEILSRTIDAMKEKVMESGVSTYGSGKEPERKQAKRQSLMLNASA
ncbi:flagellar protein FlgN [Leptospira alstonii]|uniref:FlgN protein n=2 Tax=Leptospira alstonii TaxID=28452 RepID=M6DID8_9LEPT|nr:flagellar protein FlgN [Leptospira alstonii]EMJ98280.1 FlgN protein [Leptospira alstonii serovar Sichuan str. 79601]EQA80915.1 FlgN protein [Leptospira alstonii serovar Pingchang str. 80-412]